MITIIEDENQNICLDFSGDDFMFGQFTIANFKRDALPGGVMMTNTYPEDRRDGIAQIIEGWLNPSSRKNSCGNVTRIIFIGSLAPSAKSAVLELAKQWLASYGRDLQSHRVQVAETGERVKSESEPT